MDGNADRGGRESAINHLAELSNKLDPNLPVVAVCNSAYRSSLAAASCSAKASTRLQPGRGSAAWIEAGLPVFGSETKATASAQPKRQVHLAERISPADLNRLLKDMPGTFDLVDIRPPEAFQDYALPGATNGELAEVLSNPPISRVQDRSSSSIATARWQ